MSMLNMKLNENFRGNRDELRDALTTVADQFEQTHGLFSDFVVGGQFWQK